MAGYLTRRKGDEWTKRAVDWIPRDCKCLLRRPRKRRADEFVAKSNVNYLHLQMSTSMDSRNEPREGHNAQNRPPPWTTVARERNKCYAATRTTSEDGPFSTKYQVIVARN
ncbi:hypothetical protein KIN20_035343 [Parelaphostrongylus tenuis]|uniref:Uncharacterized protein n=1 Tax=Parelaphostrongylus tenuis TaxID=148309 RepID=A0AAD5REA8_PARTN|nr:hypothetical protein KIN20_035343 [Parelaphostrongylus tenuis]